ncbi:hypothetical protein LAZ67_10000111 [Cordylochernes scorpioides]|uniref:Reverse transcriptase domain-containing protein n=1 Tax=Cordylochernes scorpioides TaxID=51811 RepID=A0ABY6KWY0_9ARAC|nr:hypothetical protein LAZ67_10000111 [Cordylochernes scorpioides]
MEARFFQLNTRDYIIALINFNKKKYLQEKQELLKNARDSANFWKTIATLKDKSYIQGNITILEWQCFYNKLLSAETTIGSDLSTLSRIDPELYCEISITEITREISSLANEKACGADEIPNEALKTLPFEHLVTLKNIFNRIINSGSYPLIWSKSIIHPIFKSGDRDNPSNYRGIALISNLSKLFTSILKSRLRNWIEGRSIIPENQAGFRKGYSCQDHIFTLLSLIQLTLRRKRRKLYAFFVDLKKAFDTVPHSLLWSKLGELGLDFRFVNLIRNYFEQMTTTGLLILELPVSFSDLLDFSVPLSEYFLYSHTEAKDLFRYILYVAILALELLPGLVLYPMNILLHFRVHSLPAFHCFQLRNISALSSGHFLGFVGLLFTKTGLSKYTRATRYHCPSPTCPGSLGQVLAHEPGVLEYQIARTTFPCRYCKSRLVEDPRCHFIGEKTILYENCVVGGVLEGGYQRLKLAILLSAVALRRPGTHPCPSVLALTTDTLPVERLFRLHSPPQFYTHGALIQSSELARQMFSVHRINLASSVGCLLGQTQVAVESACMALLFFEDCLASITDGRWPSSGTEVN